MLSAISIIITLLITLVPLLFSVFKFLRKIDDLDKKVDDSKVELSNKMDALDNNIKNKLANISNDIQEIAKETTFNTTVNKFAKISREIGWWKSDLSGKTVSVSQDLQDLTQYPEEKLLELGWLDFVHPQDRPRLIEAFSVSLKTGANFDEEFRWKLPKGNYMKVKAHTTEVYLGKLKIGYYGEMRKVTNDKTN